MLTSKASNVTQSGALWRRTNPTLDSGDFGTNPEDESRREWIEHSFDDVYELALTGINKMDDKIFNRWFPLEDRDTVKAVLGAIVKNEVNRRCIYPRSNW